MRVLHPSKETIIHSIISKTIVICLITEEHSSTACNKRPYLYIILLHCIIYSETAVTHKSSVIFNIF